MGGRVACCPGADAPDKASGILVSEGTRRPSVLPVRHGGRRSVRRRAGDGRPVRTARRPGERDAGQVRVRSPHRKSGLHRSQRQRRPDRRRASVSRADRGLGRRNARGSVLVGRGRSVRNPLQRRFQGTALVPVQQQLARPDRDSSWRTCACGRGGRQWRRTLRPVRPPIRHQSDAQPRLRRPRRVLLRSGPGTRICSAGTTGGTTPARKRSRRRTRSFSTASPYRRLSPPPDARSTSSSKASCAKAERASRLFRHRESRKAESCWPTSTAGQPRGPRPPTRSASHRSHGTETRGSRSMSRRPPSGPGPTRVRETHRARSTRCRGSPRRGPPTARRGPRRAGSRDSGRGQEMRPSAPVGDWEVISCSVILEGGRRARLRRLRLTLLLCDLDQVAAGIVENCGNNTSEVCWRLHESHTSCHETHVLGSDIVDREGGTGDPVLY